MVEIQTVPNSGLEEFRRLHNDYTASDESIKTVRSWYQKHPELLVGGYDEGTLVGYCLGRPRSQGDLELSAIAVEESHQRQGIGTELLSTLEDRAMTLGFRRISLGSAGGYVDEFYLANGYEPESVLVRLDPDDVPENYRAMGYDITEERIDNGTKKIYVRVDEYDPEIVTEIRETFDDPEAIYIMAKDIGT